MECQNYIFDDDAFHSIKASEKMHILVKKNCAPAIYLSCEEALTCQLSFEIEANAQVKWLSWNESEALDMQSTISLAKDATLIATYGEMSEGSVVMKNTIHLNGEGCQATIKSACIANHSKHFEINCIHHASHTIGLMENYAVVVENGDYKMVDTGKIESGAFGSESHQTSRVLTLNENQKAEVTPLLLIDENDVQASHATSIGQIDENQLYYLQTRGLSKEAALGLITIGYLMPVANALDNEELKKQLTEKIEKKVGLA